MQKPRENTRNHARLGPAWLVCAVRAALAGYGWGGGLITREGANDSPSPSNSRLLPALLGPEGPSPQRNV